MIKDCLLMCEALPPTLKAVSVFGGVGMLVELVCWWSWCVAVLFFVFFATSRVFLESGCPSGSHVAPFRCLGGGIWPPSGSDLALLGSLGGSMGTPKGHYVGHLAPQGVALGHQRGHIWHHGGALGATWSQDTSLEGPKQRNRRRFHSFHTF